MIKSIILFLKTVKYLKKKQLLYLIYRRIKFNFVSKKINFYKINKITLLAKPIYKTAKLTNNNYFKFLNIERKIDLNIDWNCKNYEKLWLYNLHYFDDLNSKNNYLKYEIHQNYINKWIKNNPPFIGNGWEPFTVSLRIVNWIKYHLDFNLTKSQLDSLYLQARYLFNNIEYHLLGNHLISNCKALIYAGLLYDCQESRKWLVKGLKILLIELEEQILNDGGHYELSTMYHALIVEDLLDIYNILRSTKNKESSRLTLKIIKSLNWLNLISHPDKKISFFNDAAHSIASNNDEIFKYATLLDINFKINKPIFTDLVHSGYVVYNNNDAYLIVDTANIGPDFMPGHSHADTLSFELSIFKSRFIVNSGTSTYEDNFDRYIQRSTSSHSTVEINKKNSSEVWKSFRVANRAKIIRRKIFTKNESNIIQAAHNGYVNLKSKIVHERKFEIYNKSIIIYDKIDSIKNCSANIYFHLHPDVNIEDLIDNDINFIINNKKIKIEIYGNGEISLVNSNYFPEFGKKIQNKKIIFKVNNMLNNEIKTIIRW